MALESPPDSDRGATHILSSYQKEMQTGHSVDTIYFS